MTINFHDSSIRKTYATRDANSTWASAIATIVDPREMRVADVGCGGGIYSRAWSALGASDVVGIDFSQQMLSDAREASTEWPHPRFIQATATNTGLRGESMDIVFERALIHHVPNLDAAFQEAFRILAPGGTLIVQDRTYEDVLPPASPQHLRGYFFEVFPRLLGIEQKRRPATATIAHALKHAGFVDLNITSLTETRQTYTSQEEIREDLRARTGRSILHALSDAELEHLISEIGSQVEDALPIEEHDFWTIWSATKPHE